jgi:hypothetical protein
MNNLFFILAAIAIATVILLYILSRNAQEIEEDDVPVIKFQPRNVTDLSKPVAPKKKYYKKKKKKPAITNNVSVEKRPVGRPKKSE